MALVPGRTYIEIKADGLALAQLVENFDRAPLRAFVEDGKTLLDADEMQGGACTHDAAERLVKGLGDAIRLVSTLRGEVTAGALLTERADGSGKTISERVTVMAAGCSIVTYAPTLLINGAAQPKARSLAMRVKELIDSGDRTACDLADLVNSGAVDWRVLRVMAETFIDSGYAQKKSMKEKMERVKRTAGNWENVGATALHRRGKKEAGAPQKKPPTLEEAQAWVMGLRRDWFDDHAPA